MEADMEENNNMTDIGNVIIYMQDGVPALKGKIICTYFVENRLF